MTDYPSYATLPETGSIQPTFVPTNTALIDRVVFYLERTGYPVEMREFFQKLQQVFSLSDVPNGIWTLTAIGASGASAICGASASVTVASGLTTEVTMPTAASGFTAPTGATRINRSNSYAFVEDADTYFAGRYGGSAWSALAYATREQLLITATAQIDQLRFVGQKLDAGQKLEFPRFLRRGNLSLDDDQRFIPREIFEATCEQAFHMNSLGGVISERAQLQAEGITSISIGRVSESYSGGATGTRQLAAIALQRVDAWISRKTNLSASYSPYNPVG